MTLSRNQLSGKIPATLAALNLTFVDLSRNALKGDASILFGADKNTDKIVLARNGFAFDLGKVGLSKNLATLDVRNNPHLWDATSGADSAQVLAQAERELQQSLW